MPDPDHFDLDAELEAIFGRHCVDDPDQQRRVVRRARRELEDQAVKDACRLFQQAAGIAARWSPHAEPLEWPVPARPAVRERVLRWAERREDFSVRDLMRSVDWFDRAIDARQCLDDLVLCGELHLVRPPPSDEPMVGRPPSQRYRLSRSSVGDLNGHAAVAPASDEASEEEGLDWPDF